MLNAAANLYGVVEYDAVIEICGRYAKGKTGPLATPPMGDVYLSLGTPYIVRFEPSEAVHKLVRQKLGLPLEGRLDLSDADQARFAAESIHRIYDVGGFNRIVYGR